MFENKRILAVVPARGGSKRLPGKNTMELDGRPLLAYSVLVAKASKYIDEVCVTSDSMEILEVAKGYGARLIVRPPEMASDISRTIDTVAHAHKIMEMADRVMYDLVVVLQPNVPLRLPEDIDYALAKMNTIGADTILTADMIYPKLGYIDEDMIWYKPLYEPGARKQDIHPRLRENGVLYILSRDNVRLHRLFGDKTWAVYCKIEQSVCNIDFQADFDMAKAIYLSPDFPYKVFFDKVDPQCN